ncbi:hypothetical protein BV22DRAFT_1132543 [Leucogyrophana mollusca]|uniref:Uncharacterized protein n=1 Tax=Leucogyrophana mollusca TaxID=85980 RepID=A0ACB8B6I1_9AGAM|nr:hypothetical protein BV22DRAFT_1132543 [Leucogyrophana mollusca]
MPGPCNLKKKKKLQVKRDKKCISLQSIVDNPQTPPPIYEPIATVHANLNDSYESEVESTSDGVPDDESLPHAPNIYDPGNGPRVRSARAFLSSFFAQPPSLDDPLCAEFAQEEVLQMLCTVLPEETAIILWYNKSRSTARICPSCRRLYRLGDNLPNLIEDEQCSKEVARPPQLLREQEISGLCSPVCFILASFDYPGAIKTTWGNMAEEIDDYTWELLNGPGEGRGDMGLSMLLKMARLDDLGLGQLCLPDVDFGSDEDNPSNHSRHQERVH